MINALRKVEGSIKICNRKYDSVWPSLQVFGFLSLKEKWVNWAKRVELVMVGKGITYRQREQCLKAPRRIEVISLIPSQLDTVTYSMLSIWRLVSWRMGRVEYLFQFMDGMAESKKLAFKTPWHQYLHCYVHIIRWLLTLYQAPCY